MRKHQFIWKFVSVVFAVSMTVMFAGCGNGKGASEGNNTNQTSTEKSTEMASQKSKNIEVNTAKGETNSSKAGDLKMVAEGDLTANYKDKDGMYYVYQYGRGSGEWWPGIKYVDYKACKEVFLCNKLNCDHKNFNCTAVLPKEIRDGVSSDQCLLFGDENYLYLLMQLPYSNRGSSTTEYVASGWEATLEEQHSLPDYPPTIYRMKKDGTGREKIYEFDSGISVEPVIFSDGKYLYINTIKTKETTEGNTTYSSCYDCQIVRLDIEEKSIEKVLELNSEQNIVGCNGRDVILRETQFDRDISTEFKYTNEEEYEKMYQKSQEIYSCHNIDSGKVTTIKTIENKKYHDTCLMNGYFYVTCENKKEIERIRLKDGKVKKIKTEKEFLGLGGGVSVKGKPDTLICWVEGKNEKMPYYVNSKTGEYVRSTLANSHKKHIEVISENDEYMFVKKDYTKGGTKNFYSVISKKDYLNNKPNYKDVEMIYSGETTDLPFKW